MTCGTCFEVNLKMANKQINGFRVLPLKFSAESTAHHEIFIKEHIVRHQSAETPAERTLFILNIPPYATEESIKRIFSCAGDVSNVIFKKNVNIDGTRSITGFKVAYVVFANPKGLLSALKIVKLEPLSTPDEPVICGVNKWVKEYNQSKIDPKVLEKQINEYMTEYDKRMEEKKKEEKLAGEQDDEGWVTVTKHSRKPGLARKESVEQKIKQKIEKRQQKKELKNFYTFQIRETKMKHLANLRQKFEEDKKKINSLKQARKFKPF